MNQYYADDGTPLMCPKCNGSSFHDKVLGYAGDHIVAEYEIFCTWCNQSVAYWAYGSFMPLN